jgi:hypothetical protein
VSIVRLALIAVIAALLMAAVGGHTADGKVSAASLDLIGRSAAAKLLGPGRNGRPVHASTLVRWAVSGVLLSTGERARLQALRAPGGWRTCGEWLTEFLEIVTADRLAQGTASAAITSAVRSPAAARRAHEQAEAELAAAGFYDAHVKKREKPSGTAAPDSLR